jgi:hypothetical protein
MGLLIEVAAAPSNDKTCIATLGKSIKADSLRINLGCIRGGG